METPPGGKRATVAPTREDRHEPQPLVVAEDLPEVVLKPDVKPAFIRTILEDGRPESFKSRSIVRHQVRVVAEQREQTNSEHNRDKEQEQKMELVSGPLAGELAVIERQEVLQRSDQHEEAVEQRVDEEEQEELVIRERDAVVDPRTVVVHLEDASAADGAMVASVRFYVLALVAPAHAAVDGAVSVGQKPREVFQHGHLQLLGVRLHEAFVVAPGQRETGRDSARGREDGPRVRQKKTAGRLRCRSRSRRRASTATRPLGSTARTRTRSTTRI